MTGEHPPDHAEVDLPEPMAYTKGLSSKVAPETIARLFSPCRCMHGIHVERALVPVWYAAKSIHTGHPQATQQASIQKAVPKPLSKSSVDQATKSSPSKHPAADHTDAGLEEPPKHAPKYLQSCSARAPLAVSPACVTPAFGHMHSKSQKPEVSKTMVCVPHVRELV